MTFDVQNMPLGHTHTQIAPWDGDTYMYSTPLLVALLHCFSPHPHWKILAMPLILILDTSQEEMKIMMMSMNIKGKLQMIFIIWP